MFNDRTTGSEKVRCVDGGLSTPKPSGTLAPEAGRSEVAFDDAVSEIAERLRRNLIAELEAAIDEEMARLYPPESEPTQDLSLFGSLV